MPRKNPRGVAKPYQLWNSLGIVNTQSSANSYPSSAVNSTRNSYVKSLTKYNIGFSGSYLKFGTPTIDPSGLIYLVPVPPGALKYPPNVLPCFVGTGTLDIFTSLLSNANHPVAYLS